MTRTIALVETIRTLCTIKPCRAYNVWGFGTTIESMATIRQTGKESPNSNYLIFIAAKQMFHIQGLFYKGK